MVGFIGCIFVDFAFLTSSLRHGSADVHRPKRPAAGPDSKLGPALFSLDLHSCMHLQSSSGLMREGAYHTIYRILRMAAYHALYRHANDAEVDNFYHEHRIKSIVWLALHPEAHERSL